MLIFNQPKFSSLFYGNASFVMIFFITGTGKGKISFDNFFVRRKLILARKFNDTRLFIRQNTMYTVLDLTIFCFDFCRLCQLCCPEVSCDFCEPEPEMGNDEFDGNRLIIEEEAEMAENYDQYTWKSLQSLSQLAIDEPGNVSTALISRIYQNLH